jgi:CRISPR-associated protein Cas2
MSREGTYRFLIAYDIADDRRRALVASRLKAYGERIQFSVFIVDVRPPRIVCLRTVLERILVASEDSIVICELGPIARAVEQRMEFLGLQPELLGRDAVIA